MSGKAHIPITRTPDNEGGLSPGVALGRGKKTTKEQKGGRCASNHSEMENGGKGGRHEEGSLYRKDGKGVSQLPLS